MKKNFRTYNLSLEFYRLSSKLCLPRHMKEQLSRAAASVCLNLAEGAGRSSRADQNRFFSIAFGSLRECQAILDLSVEAEHPAVLQADSLAAHIYKLTRSLGG